MELFAIFVLATYAMIFMMAGFKLVRFFLKDQPQYKYHRFPGFDVVKLVNDDFK